MASLIVQLHELTNEYIKRAKNKDIAGKICSEILLRSREVAKKYLWDGENACMFYVAPLYPILSRELLQWNNIIKRRMKAITSLARPWKIEFFRNMPREVFDLLKLTVLKGNYGKVARSTKCVDALEVTLAVAWIVHIINNSSSTVEEGDIFFKRMKDGSFCKGIILPAKPLVLTYSKSQEKIKVNMYYGFWNISGVPQHIL